MRKDELLALKSPGHETSISIVDSDFNPAGIETDTLSMELTCTNRNLPASLVYGLPGGDLQMEGGALIRKISFLRKPTETCSFERGKGAHWRLISQLSLNHLSLSNEGLAAFQEMLTLYDLPRSPISQRQIASIVELESKPVKIWMAGNPFASLVRGIEIRMVIDEDGFIGSGLHIFSEVINHFLGLYVHANSFTQLVMISRRTGEELLRCLPRSGDLNLV